MSISSSSLTSVYAQLTSFANLSNFWSLFETAFGSSYDSAKAATLRSQWQSGNFSLFPKIEIVSSNVLGSANGAYSASTNKIYLSDRFVAKASRVSLEAVLLEEFGHFVDAQVNRSDSAGDEGAIFSALVLGESLDANTLRALKAEDDRATITVNGQVIQVELQNIVGTSGGDLIDGTPGDDNINSGDSGDGINGNGGNDNINSGDGRDAINGGDGNDTIDGGDGNDAISGDDGNDTISGGDGDDFIDGGFGDDSGDDSIDGGAGDDFINGGDGNDNIDGGFGDDFINGGAGDDFINGGDGNDTIDGYDGSDTISGGNGNDSISGGDGSDKIDGGAGNDTIFGDVGDDTINGGAGKDTISGGEGNDSLVGGDGDDTFLGSKGDDTVNGDSGSNTADYSLLEQAITLKPFGVVEKAGNFGTDSLVKIQKIIASNGLNDTINASTTPAPSTGITANLGTGTLTVKGSGSSLPLKFNVSNFENVIGTNFDDTITGDKGNNRLIGNTGKDTLTGGAGNDFLDGGDGNDSLTGGVGNDTLIGGLGADKFVFTDPTEGIDIIKDFSFAEGDKIQISLRKFAATPLKATLGQFNYDSLSGNLSFLGNVLVTLENKPSDFTLKPGDQLGIQFL